MPYSRKRSGRLIHFASYKKPDGQWTAEPAEKGGYPNTAEGAGRLERKRKKQVASGQFEVAVSVDGFTVEQWLERWTDERPARNKIDERRKLIKHMMGRHINGRRLGSMALGECAPKLMRIMLRDFFRDKSIALARGSRRNIYGSLRTMFEAAVIEEHISINPCRMHRGEIPKGTRKPQRIYSRDEAQFLLDAPPGLDPVVWMAFVIEAFAGERVGEALGHRWGDWDDDPKPMGSLFLERQYAGQPLKGDTDLDERPRMIPVHLETAGIGGMAHLVNFMGSDTIEGVRFANHYYGAKMAGFSIPAAEHSTITMWGKDRELDAYRNMIAQYAKPGQPIACVSDSWDVFNAVENIWCDQLLDQVKQSGCTLVIRPDSGKPEKVVLQLLRILERKVGMPLNLTGHKQLPNYFRIIQGDGVDEDSVRAILDAMLLAGYSASNIAFGSGGALLQKLNRDTQKFAFKCSSATVDGQEIDVFKDPMTDNGKRSKRGRLALVKRDGQYQTVAAGAHDDLLETVFENGRILKTTTLDEVRERASGELFK